MYDKEEDDRYKLLRQVDEILDRRPDRKSRFLRKFIFALSEAAKGKKTENNIPQAIDPNVKIPKSKLKLPELADKKIGSIQEQPKEKPVMIHAVSGVGNQRRSSGTVPVSSGNNSEISPFRDPESMLHLKELEDKDRVLKRHVEDSQEKFYIPQLKARFKDKNWNELERLMKTPKVQTIYCNGPDRLITVGYGDKIFETSMAFKTNQEIDAFINKLLRDMNYYARESIVDLELKNGFKLYGVKGKGNIKSRFILNRY